MPQVLGWIYFSFLTYFVNVKYYRYIYPYAKFYVARGGIFFLALISIAAFGYLFNDLCDIESDYLAGKRNRMAQLKKPYRFVAVAIPFLLGSAAWVWMSYMNWVFVLPVAIPIILFIAQLLALVLYSLKPFRVKDRAELGVIFDAFYGHLNPVLITLFVFIVCPDSGIWYNSFMVILSVVCLIKGVRNILLHQIEDRKRDNSSKINTVVLKYGPWRVINFINHYLFPAEVFFLVCLTVVIGVHIPPMFIPLILFAIVSYLKLSGWKVGYADRRLLEFKFTYFMNDYYEGWFPAFTLTVLSVYRHEFVFLLILHLLFFPRFIINLVKDIKKIRENFKTEEDY